MALVEVLNDLIWLVVIEWDWVGLLVLFAAVVSIPFFSLMVIFAALSSS